MSESTHYCIAYDISMVQNLHQRMPVKLSICQNRYNQYFSLCHSNLIDTARKNGANLFNAMRLAMLDAAYDQMKLTCETNVAAINVVFV